MNNRLSILLAGPSLFVLATAAAAQPATPVEQSAEPATVAQEANEAAEAAGEEGAIVITARRRAENLLDVPQTVSAVTAADVQQFGLDRFTDIAALVPGLTLQTANNGFTAIAQMRGVSFRRESQAEVGTVEVYFNEISVEPSLIFQGNFDVGQFETFKGPQGTNRGRSSPSGAILYTTRRPDLGEIGGYVDMTGTSRGGINLQGALNIPLITDVLAVRVAGLLDHNENDGVESVNNANDPYSKTWALRGTLRFEPTDNIAAVVTYQRLERRIGHFGGILFGPGSAGWSSLPGSTLPATPGSPAIFAPANFNGPPLLASDRLAVQDFLSITRQNTQVLTGSFDWSFAGQKLSYVGGWAKFTLDSTGGGGDQSNTVVGHQLHPDLGNLASDKRIQHELRLSSEERLAGIFDYTVGGFYLKQKGATSTRATLNDFPGQFGSPLGTGVPGGPGLLSPFVFDPRYTALIVISGPRSNKERSIFANVIAHIGEKIELEGGARHIWFDLTKSVTPTATAAQVALRNTNGLGACPATASGTSPLGLPFANAPLQGSTYPGTCDYLLTSGNGILPLGVTPIPEGTRKFKAWVWKASASYKITPDLMVYAAYGTSWRPGPGPITALAACSGANPQTTAPAFDPNTCQEFNFVDPEKSKGIELGFKGSFFDRRLSLTAAVYRQKFDGLISFVEGVPFLTGGCPGGPGANGVFDAGDFNPAARCAVGVSPQFQFGADAKVKGIDVDLDFRVSDDLNLGTGFSWSKGRYSNAQVPCRDMLINATGTPGMDGIADNGLGLNTPIAWLNAGGPYGPAICTNNDTSTTTPPWSLNARGEYSHDVFTGGKAFIRALFNYTPKNKNAAASGFIPDAYGILNLFAGLRAEDGAWEVSLSARNLLNNKTRLTQGLQNIGLINAGRFGLAPSTFAPTIANSQSGDSGYRTVSFVERRVFELSARFSFGSR